MARHFWVFLCFWLAMAAYPQSNFANLHGVVRDPQNQPISGATVALTATATGATRNLVTNSAGLYEAPLILAGTYSVSIALAGYIPLSQNLTLEVDQNLSLDFHLQIASLSQSVSVKGGSIVMDSTKTSVGEVIEPKDIENLPLNGRMVLDLAVTVPGAHASMGAQEGDVTALYWRPGQNSAISVGGGRPNANYYLLDGGINTDPTFWTQNISLSLDAIQEFRVDTSTYAADEGGAGGGQINIVTRSGTKQLHGTLYDYVRNSVLDANTFEQMNSNNYLVQNQFGGSLGGPTFRARHTFFFVNFEGYRHVQTESMTPPLPNPATLQWSAISFPTIKFPSATSIPSPPSS
jgi:hypothetical protein